MSNQPISQDSSQHFNFVGDDGASQQNASSSFNFLDLNTQGSQPAAYSQESANFTFQNDYSAVSQKSTVSAISANLNNNTPKKHQDNSKPSSGQKKQQQQQQKKSGNDDNDSVADQDSKQNEKLDFVEGGFDDDENELDNKDLPEHACRYVFL